MYEKMYARIASMVASAPPAKQKLFQWALDVGAACIPYQEAQKRLPLALRAQRKLADKLVLSKLRARLGLDRASALLSGAAPLSPAVHRFFLSIGLRLLEAYGLTETTPGLTANRPDRWKLGTVGPAIRGVTLTIAADGEILAKGPNITPGYLKRDDANAEAFDSEGWFHTGDVGELDRDGFLKITDRKKDLLKTSGGKYVAPQKLEGMLKSKSLVQEAVVIGDDKPFCTVLLVVDEDALKAWAERTGNAADKHSPAVHAVLQGHLDELNQGLASFESLKYFRVVDEPFTVANGTLTGSFKVKRKVVLQKHAALVDAMYATKKGNGA
jgi:long-chain acyl-CoA synthetase